MSDEQLAYAFAAHNKMERMRRYVVGGRQFAGLSEGLLSAQWVDACRTLDAHRSDTHWEHMLRLECEFELRRLSLPVHLVGPERDRIREREGRRRPQSKRYQAIREKRRLQLRALRMRLAEPKH